jgi:hypothetical protein
MRLADFIERNKEAVLAEWDVFAGSLLPAGASLDNAALRDHAETLLLAIAKLSLRTSGPRRPARSRTPRPQERQFRCTGRQRRRPRRMR